MAKFSKKRGKGTPAISTASLPDIIFMLLFFFMVATVMRDASLKINVNTPVATELTKIKDKSLVNNIYIGKPVAQYQNLYGTSPILQLGDKCVRKDAIEREIPLFLEQHKLKVPESRHPMIYSSIKADGKVTMGIIQDLKTALRKANQLKINYSAKPRAEG
ncbi:MAG: biopolymer transporter ExbD [Saprospiraceae bacterium]|nr:biopolymer transporter ExbD [Saprospiraceae bacterium]